MARLVVHHDTNPALSVELVDIAASPEDEPDWSGLCSGCGWAVTHGARRYAPLDDAVNAAIVHLDHQH